MNIDIVSLCIGIAIGEISCILGFLIGTMTKKNNESPLRCTKCSGILGWHDSGCELKGEQ